jgi:hypothetical protein
MRNSQFDQRECLMFWTLRGNLREAVKDGRSKEVNHLLDDIEGISRNTDQVTLRKRCVDLLSQFRVAEAAESVSR